MKRRNYRSGNEQSAALCWLVAAVLTAATAGFALAQTVQAPAAAPGIAPQAPEQAAAPAAPAPSAVMVLPPQPPPPALPPPTEKRGFLNDFGKWWDKSVTDFNAKMKEQQTKVDAFNKQSSAAAKDAATATQEAMKNAADAMVRLPTSRVIEIHEVCALAGNGAPDCGPVVTNACRAKGFNTGQPVDIRTAEKCTASLWVSGQAPSGDCPVETVVLRAACQ